MSRIGGVEDYYKIFEIKTSGQYDTRMKRRHDTMPKYKDRLNFYPWVAYNLMSLMQHSG